MLNLKPRILLVLLIFQVAALSLPSFVNGQDEGSALHSFVLSSGGDRDSSDDYNVTELVIGEPIQGVFRDDYFDLLSGYVHTNNIEEKSLTQIPTPILNPVTSPTNETPQIISGTKAKNTSISLNGYKIIPINQDTTWSYSYNLSGGENWFAITAKDVLGNESNSVVGCIVKLE